VLDAVGNAAVDVASNSVGGAVDSTATRSRHSIKTAPVTTTATVVKPSADGSPELTSTADMPRANLGRGELRRRTTSGGSGRSGGGRSEGGSCPGRLSEGRPHSRPVPTSGSDGSPGRGCGAARAAAVAVAAASVVAAYGRKTVAQAGAWRDPVSLWGAAFSANQGGCLVAGELGMSLVNAQRPLDALPVSQTHTPRRT
jgi:hypothetical protein